MCFLMLGLNMNYIDDKLDIIESDNKKDSSNKPRQHLKNHLTYKDGTPKYRTLESDNKGRPMKIVVTNRMDGVESIWNRVVGTELFEKE